MNLTLPTDSAVRKDVPLQSGCYAYFPAALAGVAMHSKAGNDKHNPGEPLHHSRGKSMDHADCISRHLMDLADMQAHKVIWTQAETDAMLAEANALCWRALALSQELHEKFGAPLAPAARLPKQSIADAVPPKMQESRPHQPDCGLDTDHKEACLQMLEFPAEAQVRKPHASWCEQPHLHEGECRSKPQKPIYRPGPGSPKS